MQNEPSNRQRAAAARFAVEAYSAKKDSDRQSLEENIIDLLTDLRHLLTAEGIDCGRCLYLAGLHHEAESEKTYNGWTNYETWAVHLLLTNEQGSYFYWRDQARQQLDHAPHSQQVRDGVWTSDRAALFRLADQIKEELEDEAPMSAASTYSDLLNAALSEVNWSEIAQAIIDEAQE